jgi:hypothetical protein
MHDLMRHHFYSGLNSYSASMLLEFSFYCLIQFLQPQNANEENRFVLGQGILLLKTSSKESESNIDVLLYPR